MKQPYKKGVAPHLGPESCADDRKAVGEALTGGTRRPAIELRNHHFGVPTLSRQGEGHTGNDAKRAVAGRRGV
jgi:RNA-directed DNA polymerase